MSRIRAALLVVAGFTVPVVWAPPAWARDPAAAEALYRSAREASKKGDWERACAQFAESQRLDPAPGTLINLADCEEKRGLIASAWSHYVEVEPQFKPADPRAAFAHEHAAALDPRIPRITIKVEPPLPADARVFRDDVELGRASLGVPLPVEPGAHTIIVKLGSAETRAPISVSEGSTTDVVVTAPGTAPEPSGVSAPASRPEPVSTQRPADHGNGRKTLGWALAGAGGVGVAVGTVTGVLALSKASTVKDTCGPDYLTCSSESVDEASSGRSLATVSTVAFIAGGALAAAGLYFILRAPSVGARAAGASAQRILDVGLGGGGTFFW